jgi:hypothetical protein
MRILPCKAPVRLICGAQVYQPKLNCQQRKLNYLEDLINQDTFPVLKCTECPVFLTL